MEGSLLFHLIFHFRWLLSGGLDGYVNVWDLTMGTCLHRFEHKGAITSFDFHPNEFLLSVASEDKTITFYEVEHFTEVSSIEVSSVPKVIAFHPSGQNLIAGFEDCLQSIRWDPCEVIEDVSASLPNIADLVISRYHFFAASIDGANCTLSKADSGVNTFLLLF